MSTSYSTLMRRAERLRDRAAELLSEAASIEADAAALRARKSDTSTGIIRELLPTRGQWTVVSLVHQSGYTEETVRRVLRQMREAGEVESHRYGWWSATETLLRASTARGTVAA